MTLPLTSAWRRGPAAWRRSLATWGVALAFASSALGWTVAPRSAEAQVTDEVEARALFEEGNRLFAASQRSRGERRRDLAERALVAYAQSLAQLRSRNALYNAAMTLVLLERPAEAHAYLVEYEARADISDEERAESAGVRQRLEAELGVLILTATPAEVEIARRVSTGSAAESDPDADASARWIPLGPAPLRLGVDPGSIELGFRAPGYDEQSVTLTLSAGEVRDIAITLLPSPVAIEVVAGEEGETPAALDPTLAGALTLSVDGEPRPLGTLELPPGAHRFTLDHRDGRQVEREVDVSAEVQRVTLTLPRPVEPAEPEEAADEGTAGRDAALGEPDLSPSTEVVEPSPSWAGPALTLSLGVGLLGGAIGLRARSGTFNRRYERLEFSDDPNRVAEAARLARRIDRVNRAGRWTTAAGALFATTAFVWGLRVRARRAADSDDGARGDAEDSEVAFGLMLGLGLARLDLRFGGL